ncbi:MAG: glycosyltransferase family 4 protein [Pseudomonadales bacterium]|nr:glycosyltransferase family 4 protein [Pseudomonadales bacterium]MCP5188066.1 glycosyltransferase family 4 protein [Pseudomonadales bacterium]
MEKPRILALFGGAVLFGQERGNIEALASLKEQGCEVLCLVRDEEWSLHITPALDGCGLQWVKVPYIEHRMPGRMWYVIFRNPVAFVLANWHFIRIIRVFRPTHIHAFNPLYVLNFMIGLSLVPIPMIYRAGDQPTVHNWIWRALWRFIVSRSTHFVAISRFISESLHDNGVDIERITVIYNSPPRRPTKASIDLGWLVDRAGSRFVYVGQIAQHKGVHLLIEAFRVVVEQYPQAYLIIAGRISDWKGDKWARDLRASTLADPWLQERVTFTGEIPYVPELLRLCDVLVVPSVFQEPLSNVVPEAKAAGIPSIVFPCGGLPELIEDGVDGSICSAPTVAALADKLRVYMGEPMLAAQQGEAALASLSRFGVKKFAKRWLEVYMNSMPHGRL